MSAVGSEVLNPGTSEVGGLGIDKGLIVACSGPTSRSHGTTMLETAPSTTPTEIPVTDAAISTYRVLQDALGCAVLAYERPDGGLIVEHRPACAPPVYYRITHVGTIEPDKRLDPLTRQFVPLALPSVLP